MKLPFSLYRISGHSMEPLIKEGSIVLVFRWIRKLRVGDVAVFQNHSQVFVKRVKFIRGEGYFLEGDNREDSLDSRKLGLIKREEILGKVVWVI